jgi:hypothetical protein
MKLGLNTINTVKLGNSQVSSVYLGSNLVWQNAPVATAATGISDTSFTANWNAYTGATYYLLDVSLSSSFSTFVLQDQVVFTNSYSVTGLSSNTTYYYRVRASDDSDIPGFFDRVTTAGGSLTNNEKIAIVNLVEDLKDYGIWTKMKAIYPMVGASAAACAQNLKSSSFTGIFSSGWTFSSTGITSNGSSTYMDTGLNANSNLTVQNAHFSIYVRVKNGGGDQINGAYTGIFIDQYNATNVYYGIGVESDVNATNQIGMFQVNAFNSSMKLFKNGSSLLSRTSGGTLPNVNLNLGRSGSGTPYWWNGTLAFSSIGDGLTDTEASNFYTAVQAFQTTLSRNV